MTHMQETERPHVALDERFDLDREALPYLLKGWELTEVHRVRRNCREILLVEMTAVRGNQRFHSAGSVNIYALIAGGDSAGESCRRQLFQSLRQAMDTADEVPTINDRPRADWRQGTPL